ncbi:hypothetical protein [Streptomyces yatensis]|uniref:hypothetical protein n=1 Tax=Streptomyces yatensis TaxID=155177 RepID=UPI001B3C9CE4|nr:hypothetical protein [Streptomyces yatensis]
MTSGPRTVERWRRYLAEYSVEMLRLADADQLEQVGDDQRAAGWLGAEGADEHRLTAVEERLGAPRSRPASADSSAPPTAG